MSRRSRRVRYQVLHSFGLAFSTPRKDTGSSGINSPDLTARVTDENMATKSGRKTLKKGSSLNMDKGLSMTGEELHSGTNNQFQEHGILDDMTGEESPSGPKLTIRNEGECKFT